ncbi:MAG: hypothetical protein KA735_13060 [Burkholderiaceae bacterium]|nr:hypothetical protein [Burkholderiaceae bacterium]
MKALIFLLALAYASSAGAEQQDREKWLGICSDISNTGGMVMTARQKGITREAIIKAANGDRIIGDLIETAYQAEIYPTEEERQAMAIEFEKGLYQKCLKGAPFK